MRGELHISQLIRELESHDLLPAIVFRTARAQCDLDAEAAYNHKNIHLEQDQKRHLLSVIEELTLSYDIDEQLIKTHPHFPSLINTGVGAHHAGQLLHWRLLLEELMTRGLLRVLVATGTVAAGVDFPARTVVVTAHSRRGAEGYENLSSSEFQQMSGRAGRRGKDKVGFCLAAPTPFCDPEAILKISKRPPEPLKSAYFPAPSTILNLLKYRNVDDLRFTVQKSLASFSDRILATTAENNAKDVEEELEQIAQETEKRLSEHDLKKKAKRANRFYREAESLRGKQIALLDKTLDGLRSLGYLDAMMLAEKGYWAANLRTSFVLELTEFLEAKIFEDASHEHLMAVIGSIVGDEHRQYLRAKMPLLKKEEEKQLTDILTKVQKAEIPGVSDNRRVLQNAAYTVVSWSLAESWQEFRGILILSGVAEGDAARLITQTAEQLNQLSRLQDYFPALAEKATEAQRKLLRPPLTDAINFDIA